MIRKLTNILLLCHLTKSQDIKITDCESYVIDYGNKEVVYKNIQDVRKAVLQAPVPPRNLYGVTPCKEYPSNEVIYGRGVYASGATKVVPLRIRVNELLATAPDALDSNPKAIYTDWGQPGTKMLSLDTTVSTAESVNPIPFEQSVDITEGKGVLMYHIEGTFRAALLILVLIIFVLLIMGLILYLTGGVEERGRKAPNLQDTDNKFTD